jgi:cell division transport system ATP-binding protein
MALALVGLSRKDDSFPHELSGGEQQRVGLARALINNPSLIIADEPTGNLDPQSSLEIMDLLDEINQRGTTVLIITHEKSIVDRMQKRVIEIDNGIIIRDEKKGSYQNENPDD